MTAGACTSDPYAGDWAAQALRQRIASEVEGKLTLEIGDLRLLDSIPFGTEFDRRIDIFEKRIIRNSELYMEYNQKGMKKNAELKREAIAKDRVILDRLTSLKELYDREGKLLETAYYEYGFSASAHAGGKSTKYQDYYFSLTPGGRIISITQKRRDLARSGGLSIPEYEEIIRGNSDGEPDPDR